MKGKFGMMMVAGSGALGGHVVTRNRQGVAVRTKTTPINRRSTSQTGTRQTFSTLSQNWRALSEAQRQSWINAAPDFTRHNVFGDTYHPTGKNLYMIINANILIAGGTVVSAPPAETQPVALTAVVFATNTSAAQSITFLPTPVPANTVVVIQATRPLSAGIESAGKQFRQVVVIPAAGTSPENSLAAYTAKFGAPITGKKIFYNLFTIHMLSGLRSLPTQIGGITA